MKKKVLILAGYYIPSVKGGGPIQSIKNLVDNLSDKITFYIVANDRDLGDDKPFSNISIDNWVDMGKSKVFYTDISKLTFKKTTDIINSVEYDILYLNSFFDYKLSIIPILLWKLNKIKAKVLVLAPRGQFSPGALGLKGTKKRLFLNIAKKMNLYSGITWHATADIEKKDILEIFGYKANVLVANNLTANYHKLEFNKELKKSEGELKIVFISRIHPKKNLKQALEFIKSIEGKIDFNIYGPIEDNAYWSECESIINNMPSNIKVAYKGTVEHNEVIKIFNVHHVFLFPTLGENFGHVISEALIGGCPLIISDQTPWRKLEENKVGWDIELNNYTKFINVIQYCVNLGNKEYEILSKSAFEYGKRTSADSLNSSKYFEIFKV